MAGSQRTMRFLLGSVLSLLIVQTRAQTPPDVFFPTCTLVNWDLLGPHGESPCEVLLHIMDACAQAVPGAAFNLPNVNSLPLAQYPPPDPTDPLRGCKCTDTVYNLYSACGACQNGSRNWPTRQGWFNLCHNQSPSGVVFGSNLGQIAPWMNQTYIPTFDIGKAVEFQSQSTNTLLSSQTVLEGTLTSDPTTSPTVGTLDSGTSSSTNSGKSRTGAIIGGVVGIVIIVAIIAFCIIYSIRYRRAKKRTPASAEFMKYAQGNADGRKSATTPLTYAYRPDGSEENLQMRTVAPGSGGGGAYHQNQDPRASIIRLDHDTGTNALDRVPMPSRGARGSRDEELPAFTPGLFKDPIFEKGVALNLAAAAAAASSSGGHSGGVGGSPVTYSPATPSLAHTTNEHARLIPGKQNSAGSAL